MIYIINCSARQNGNTAQLLKAAQKGAEDAGRETCFVNLFKLNYKGCASCFACKLKSEKFKSTCIQRDDLQPVLKGIKQSDGLIIGTPVYYMNISGAMQSFIERLYFSNYEYTERSTCYPGKLPTGFIYTMNVPADYAESCGLLKTLSISRNFAETIFGVKPEALCAFDTLQFDDYSRYLVTRFSEEKKRAVRETQFPKDLESAYEMGRRIALAKK